MAKQNDKPRRSGDLSRDYTRVIKERNKASQRRYKQATSKATREQKGAVIYKAAMSGDEKPLVEEILSRVLRARGGSVLAETELLNQRTQRLLTALDEKAARFFTLDYVEPLCNLICAGIWQRPLEGWKPKSKGRDAQFRSLVRHLLCKYPVPNFLFRVFDLKPRDEDTRMWLKFFAAVGRGESAVKTAKALIPTPLTKKMVHRFMQTTQKGSLLSAIRWVQVTEFTDDLGWARRLHSALMATRQLQSWRAREEPFWETIIRFFSRQAMLDPREVGPLIDYIHFTRLPGGCNDLLPEWTIKGRTIASLTTARDEWHAELHKVRKIKGAAFKPSGYPTGLWRKKLTGEKGIWAYCVGEILTKNQLSQEGRVLNHCVLSYWRGIEAGRTSIWSLRRWECHEEHYHDKAEDKMKRRWVEHGDFDHPESRYLTIEVSNTRRTIVQVRGKHNRPAKAVEQAWIRRWAQEVGLIYG